MTNNYTAKEVRAQFETWAKSRQLDLALGADSWGSTIYKHPFIEAMWDAWKAAHAGMIERREAGVTDERTKFSEWWRSSKYCQVVYSGPAPQQVARDAWQASQLAVWPVAAKPEPNHLEPDGGNLYRAHNVMVHSGQFWRCAHGKTGLDGKECAECRAAEPAQPADNGRVMDALRDLVEACEAEFCSDGTDAEPDNSKVAYPEDECHITFGHIRRARAALAAQGQPAKPVQTCTCPSGDGSLRWPCPVHPPAERVPDGYAKSEEITEYRRIAARTLGTLGGGVAVFLSDKLDRTYTVPVYFGLAAAPRPVAAERVPEGWVLVPRDMTAAQEEAMVAAWNQGPHAVREAMIAAATPQPGESNTEDDRNG